MKHGKWLDCSNGWMCSVCKNDSSKDSNYCPHCGAKMDFKIEFMEPMPVEWLCNYAIKTDNTDVFLPMFMEWFKEKEDEQEEA